MKRAAVSAALVVVLVPAADVFAQGDVWTCATPAAAWPVRAKHTSVVFDNKLWVLGGGLASSGFKNDVWFSADGVNWTSATLSAAWSARENHTSLVFGGKIWVMGGFRNGFIGHDVWYSIDGSGWSLATGSAGWSARYGHGSVVYDNKMWVMGGYGGNYVNDVWCSTDGANWTQVTAAAPWTARARPTSVVYDNKMWVIGGQKLGGVCNDVWYSSDGVNWTCATAEAPWSARCHHTSVVFDNKLWVFGGGVSGGGFTSDVWYSTDGANWVQATASAEWTPRLAHTAVSFDNRMWVFGGSLSGAYSSDVWYSGGAAEIWANPMSFDVALASGGSENRTLTIGNEGTVHLAWSVTEVLPASWLSEDPAGGDIDPGDDTSVAVTFNAIGLSPGIYSTTLRISSNDPEQQTLDVPVKLEVLLPSLPKITVSDVDSLGQGQTMVIRGQTRCNSGTPYVPGPGDLVVDDPVRQATVVLSTNAAGEFSHAAVLPDSARMLAFVFRLVYTDGGDTVSLVVPVPPAGSPMELSLSHIADAGALDAVSSRTNLLSRYNAATHVPEARNAYFNAALVLGRDIASLLETGWGEYCNDGSTVSLLWASEASLAEDDLPERWPEQGLGTLTVVLDSGRGTVLSGFRVAVERVIDAADPANKQAYKDLLNSASSALTGVAAVRGTGIVDIGVASMQFTTLDAVDTAAVYDVRFESGDLQSFRFTGYGGSGCVLAGSVSPLANSALKFRVTCPVDLLVTDPQGRVVSRNSSEVPGAGYFEADLDGDGDPDDEVVVPDPIEGVYWVDVLPEPEATPDDSFTLVADWPGNVGVVVLTENMQLKDVSGAFGVTYGRGDLGWTEVAPMPDSPTDKPVKDGGWLAKGPDVTDDGEVIYAAKGCKTTDFYKYHPEENAWYSLADIPAEEDGKIKPPKKGCRGCSDETQAVYMTRGANRVGFWRYDIEADVWSRMNDVPLGPSGKRVKYGEDMVYVFSQDTGWIYLLKGYRTEFFRYNTVSGEWDTTLPEIPWKVAPKYKNGSFLVYDGVNTIYAHQANYYDKTAGSPQHSMFKYDIGANIWQATPLRGVPVCGMEKGKEDKRKKSKDGACGAWYDGNMYALKGGNTQSFWKYYPDEDSWIQLRDDTLPQYTLLTDKKRRVKQGADLVHYGEGVFYALKGNKTRELWRYIAPLADGELRTACGGRTGIMADESDARIPKLQVFPNPIASGFARVQYSLPQVGPATLAVYDVVGRVTLRQAVPARRTGSVNLDLRELAAGVHFVRFDADSYSATQKVVIQTK